MSFRFLRLCFFLCISLQAQNEDFLKASTVPLELKIKANAVVRLEHKKIEITSVKSLTTTIHRVVTVLNELGEEDINAYVGYDSNINIKKLEATVYDKFGKKVKRFKKSDFEDVSAVSNFSLYEDSRTKYLKYTALSYPFTVEFHCETSTQNTAYIPSWYPLQGYYVSTENSTYEVIYDSSQELKIKEQHLEKYAVSNASSEGVLLYRAKNIQSIKPEAYSPSFRDFAPKVQAALKTFYYEKYIGETNDWESLGKWMYDELLVSRVELSVETQARIKALVKGVEDPIEKAKIVYNYVQDQTRYISVQEGIGGIQPEMASKVDALKYGDCKGLTNYTKALMEVVGVEANYTRVHASRRLTDVDEDFVTFLGQTNHVILNIPTEDGDIWLECTSQTSPFNYTANFTDDRDVFVLTPEGGKIVHTKVYPTEDNLQSTNATINVGQDGHMSADVIIKSYGYQYGMHEGVQNASLRDQKMNLKTYWDYINNLSIESIRYENDKDSIVFTEIAEVSSTSYTTKSGKRLLFQPNAFNRIKNAPTRYKIRTLDFEIERGITDTDEYTITIDPSFKIEAIPNAVSIDNQFGSYMFSIEKISEDKLLYKRQFIRNKGYYPKEEYAAFRDFMTTVVKHDNTKIVFISKT